VLALNLEGSEKCGCDLPFSSRTSCPCSRSPEIPSMI
jgi:hypothetical protein